jgi:hypothetical protein
MLLAPFPLIERANSAGYRPTVPVIGTHQDVYVRHGRSFLDG